MSVLFVLLLDVNTRFFKGIFTDSKAALQILSRRSRSSPHHTAAADISYLHHLACIAGHTIKWQWIPGHSGIIGNQKADEAARMGLNHRKYRKVYFTKTDASTMAHRFAVSERNRLWRSNEPNNEVFLHAIDPDLTSKLPRELPRRLETLYHRLRLNSAYTNSYLFRLGLTINPYCDNCSSIETVEHILLECVAYLAPRSRFFEDIERLDQGPVTLKTILGPWTSPSKQRQALKSLFSYLEDTSL